MNALCSKVFSAKSIYLGDDGQLFFQIFQSKFFNNHLPHMPNSSKFLALYGGEDMEIIYLEGYMAEGKIHPLFRNRYHIKNIDQDPSTSSVEEDSTLSNESDSYDTTDDASSSNSSRSTSYDFSELMAQLPIKKGLSKFYEGKSESFTTLSRVTSIQDLAKKTTPPYRRKLKASKSCATGLNLYKPYTLSKPIISKKSTEPSPDFPRKRPQQRDA